MRILILSLFVAGCSGAKIRPDSEAIRIELKGKPGAVLETRYQSNSHVKTFADGQILRDKQESVDFTVVTKIKAFDEKEKVLTYSVSTVAKDGTVDLHDLAFPEKNEEIEFKARTNGVVLKAGKYPPQSLFFVPSLPVPKDEVRVGDTWTMDHTWYSAHDGIPLKLDVIGILKDMVPCGGGLCADIEVSGSIKLSQPPTSVGARFASRVWGRVLYSPSRGDIVWSEMRSQEEMDVGSEKMSVLSCMVSETLVKDRYKTPVTCTPDLAPVLNVPKNL